MGHVTVGYLGIAPGVIPGGCARPGAGTPEGNTAADPTPGIGVMPGTRSVGVFRHRGPD